MGVRILRKVLGQEAKDRGIIYTSTLSTNRTELVGDTTHEIHKDDEDRTETKRRLEDASFFNNSHFKFNIIRE